jgi:hypothetical protein
MKKTKLVVLALVMFMLVGCNLLDRKENEPRNNTYEETYQLSFFYIETCPRCQAFEKEALPLIEEEFGNNMEITKYDIDDFASKEPYDTIVAQLVDFGNDDEYGSVPLVVLDGYFAKLGYADNDGEELVNDFIRAVKGKPLGDTLSNDRYLFKDGKIK